MPSSFEFDPAQPHLVPVYRPEYFCIYPRIICSEDDSPVHRSAHNAGPHPDAISDRISCTQTNPCSTVGCFNSKLPSLSPPATCLHPPDETISRNPLICCSTPASVHAWLYLDVITQQNHFRLHLILPYLPAGDAGKSRKCTSDPGARAIGFLSSRKPRLFGPLFLPEPVMCRRKPTYRRVISEAPAVKKNQHSV